MKKVVYNSSYGGFSLSAEAIAYLMLMGFPLSHFPLEGSGYKTEDFTLVGGFGFRGHTQYGLVLREGVIYSDDCLSPYSAEGMALRSHPALVKVVQELGKRACGSCCHLDITEVQDDMLYRISEYDGMEQVITLAGEVYVNGHAFEDVPFPGTLQLSEDTPSQEKPLALPG